MHGQLRVHAHCPNIVLLHVTCKSGFVAIPVTTTTEHRTAIEESFRMYHVNTFRMKNAELFKGIPSGKKQVTMLRRVKNLFLCLIFTNTKSSRVKFNLTGQYYRHVPNINVNTDCKRIKITTSQDVPPPYVRESSTFIFKVREFLP